MILRLTQKARDKVKIPVLDVETATNSPTFLDEWFVNHIIMDRKQYFIFSEAMTLYSVIVRSAKINTRQAMSNLATDILFSVFKRHADLDIKLFEKLADKILILKTNNRRVVGSQNDLIYMAEGRGEEDFALINQTPMSFLEYRRPDEALKQGIQSYL